jgi:hypothetical protein
VGGRVLELTVSFKAVNLCGLTSKRTPTYQAFGCPTEYHLYGPSSHYCPKPNGSAVACTIFTTNAAFLMFHFPVSHLSSHTLAQAIGSSL